MASPPTPSQPLSPDHLVTVKVLYNENNRRFKLPLKDLKPQVFPQKVICSPPELPDRTSPPAPSLIIAVSNPAHLVQGPFTTPVPFWFFH